MMICGQAITMDLLLGSAFVVGAGGVITVGCIVAALKMLIRPGEKAADHPKRRILAPDR